MKREQVWKSVSQKLREDFGRLLDVRDVRRVRRVSGEAWVVTVALAAIRPGVVNLRQSFPHRDHNSGSRPASRTVRSPAGL